MLSVCSFEGRVIQQVLNGLKHSITQSLRLALARKQLLAVPEDLLENWDSLFTCPSESNPLLLNQLLAKQIQQHDAIRRSENTERLSNFQRQNQELLQALNLKDEFFSSLCQELPKFPN